MKKALIVTEGKHDAEILQKVLPQEMLEKLFIISGGFSALSLARTALVTEQIPTVLFMDADSNNENAIYEKQTDLTESLKSVSIGTKFKVLLMVPEAEVLFLENPNFVRTISNDNKEFSAFELHLAKGNPKKFLSEISGNGKMQNLYPKLLKNLDAETISAMKNHASIKELIEFLSSVLVESEPVTLALNK